MLQPSQLQALIQLTGSGRMSQPMQAALHDVFCVDVPDEHAVIAARHGVSVRGLRERLRMARDTIKLAYALIVPTE